MKKTLILIALAVGLAACGDFYTFNEEPDDWKDVTMRAQCDGAYVMVGDTMPLVVKFEPRKPNDYPVFWLSSDTVHSRIISDSLVGRRAGNVDLVVFGGGGRLVDSCRVHVIERWEKADFHIQQPSDMVIYADVTVNGKPWDDKTQILGAFVGGELTGLAVPREAFGIPYAELRIWAPTNQGQGKIDLRCYDKKNFRLYVLRDDIEYDAYQTLGTLSNLYPIKFER